MGDIKAAVSAFQVSYVYLFLFDHDRKNEQDVTLPEFIRLGQGKWQQRRAGKALKACVYFAM